MKMLRQYLAKFNFVKGNKSEVIVNFSIKLHIVTLDSMTF